jgi:ATP-dependent Clp protease ATP-binding subunit ClpA
MFERFTKDAREIATAAQAEAAGCGARRVEAEHLLIALAGRGVAGLDEATVRDALEDEQRRSLAAVGVSAEDLDIPAPVVGTVTKLRFATSAKRALELAVRVALERGDRRIDGAHIVLALLRAEAGTVPRALVIAGIDREDLAAAADAELR